MFKDSWFDTGILRMRLKVAEDKVKSFETGQEYVKLKKQHAITCNEYLQKIKNLEYELSHHLGKPRMGKTRDLFKKIRDTKGTFHAKMDSVKDRNAMDLTEAEDIKKGWQEYTEKTVQKRASQPR